MTIRIDKLQEIEGVTVYGDDSQANKFYAIPNQPRYRLDASGKPVFLFMKYREPINRPGGATGGGFVVFDTEFVVPDPVLAKIKKKLEDQLASQNLKDATGQPLLVEFGALTYTKGTSKLQLLDSTGKFVQKIDAAGQPSMFGHNVACWTAELTQEGATLLEQALQGAGGVAQVIYDLYFTVILPPLHAVVWFNASKFYDFYQTIDDSGGSWDSSNNTRDEKQYETFHDSQSGGVEFQLTTALPDPDQDKKVKDAIRNWGMAQLDVAVKTAIISDIKPQEDKSSQGMEHMHRHIVVNKSSSFYREYNESDAVEWHMVPQGTLPNITNIPGVKWADYSRVVDLNDPFFKTLNVILTVNADFQNFPVQSVDVHLEYNQGNTHTISDPDAHIKSPDEVFKFASYTENDFYKYTYQYVVNYRGRSDAFTSPKILTDRTALTIDVGDLGLLDVTMLVGSVNFDQIQQVQVTLQYEDPGNVPLIERQFTFDKDNRTRRMQEVILVPRTKPYRYKVVYFMPDRQIATGFKDSVSSQIYVNDPFSARKTIGLRALGDLDADIDTMFVDLKYTDPTNNYTQTKSVPLSKTQPFFDWTFPVIDPDAGVASYSGMIKYKNKTDEPIPQTTITKPTVYVGPQYDGILGGDQGVTVDAFNIDFAKVKMVKIDFSYADPANQIQKTREIVLHTKDQQVQPWLVYLKDHTKNTYKWQVTYYLPGTPPVTVKTPEGSSTDSILVLEMPASITLPTI